MNKLMIMLSVLALAACGSDADADTKASNDVATESGEKAAISSEAPPNFAEYPRECPEDWGIVVGANKDHVDNFIQNYFYVPKSGSSPMYSEITTLTSADGATIVKAGTYNMLDTIVDQEMVTSFTAGKMTQCGSRLRCAADPETWVASCD